jgi:hypothetical protein
MDIYEGERIYSIRHSSPSRKEEFSGQIRAIVTVNPREVMPVCNLVGG